MVSSGRHTLPLRLPADLFERLRARAFAERRSINALVVEAVERQLQEPRPAASEPPVPAVQTVRPPVLERPSPASQRLLATLRRLPEDKAREMVLGMSLPELFDLAAAAGVNLHLAPRERTRTVAKRLFGILRASPPRPAGAGQTRGAE